MTPEELAIAEAEMYQYQENLKRSIEQAETKRNMREAMTPEVNYNRGIPNYMVSLDETLLNYG